MFKSRHVVKLAFASVVALGLSVGARQAQAGTVSYSGSNCRPTLSAVDQVEYSAFGIHNTASGLTQTTVSCPIPIPFTSATTGTLQTVTVHVYDRNNGGLPVLIGTDFSCTIFFQNSAGTTFATTTAHPHLFSVPTLLSFTLSPGAITSGATMHCDIPTQSPSGLSHILNYIVTTS